MTDEEKESFTKRINASLAVVDRAHGQTAATGRRTGKLDCPLCEGKDTVGYSIAFNGHVAAKCSTPGCIVFIQ